MQDAAKTAKSELLKDMLEAGSSDPGAAGINTRIRAMISEVMLMPPLKLANMLSSSAKETASEICHRAAEYVVSRIEKRDELSEHERQAAIQETTELFSDFLSELKLQLMREFVEVENFVFNNTYIVDPELFAEGFMRFSHQEGVDYTRPDEAHELSARVEQAESEVEAQLREVGRLRSEIQAIDQITPKVEELSSWLNTALSSGLSVRASQIREISDQVARGVSLLRRS